jgi:TolA-binding protein
MTRTFKTLATACLGAAFLFTGAACEDKETSEALQTCRTDLATLQKTAAAQTTTINQLKAQLAEAQGKVEELSKAGEPAQTGKNAKATEEKGKGGEAKKGESAKAEPKGKEGAKQEKTEKSEKPEK